MGKTFFTVPGVIPNPQYGKGGPVKDPAGNMVALYFLGDLYETGAPLNDWSPGGTNDATETGSGIGDYALVSSGSNYVTTPISGDDLAVNNAVTIVALAKAGSAQSALICANFPASPDSASISLAFPNNAAVRAFTISKAGVNAAPQPSLATDSARGDDYAAYASTHSLTGASVYIKKPGGALASNTATFGSALNEIGGVRAMRIGYGYDATFSGSASVAIVALFDGVLTAGQIEIVMDSMLACIDTYGLNP